MSTRLLKCGVCGNLVPLPENRQVPSVMCTECYQSIPVPTAARLPAKDPVNVNVPQTDMPRGKLPLPPPPVKSPVSDGSRAPRCRICQTVLTGASLSSGTCPACTNTVTVVGSNSPPHLQKAPVNVGLMQAKSASPPVPVNKPASDSSPVPRCRTCQRVLTGDGISDGTCPGCSKARIGAVAQPARPDRAQPAAAPAPASVAATGARPTVPDMPFSFRRVSLPVIHRLSANRGRILAVGVAILICASLTFLAASARTVQSRAVTPLDFVRADSDLLLHFRLADIWNSSPIQDFYQRLPDHIRRQSEDTVSRVGVGMEHIESVSITFTNPQQPAICAVVKTNRKYTLEDQKKILSSSASAESVKWETHTHRGLTYHVGNGRAPGTPDTPLAVYTANEQLFVLGTEVGVKSALDSYLDSPVGSPSKAAKAKTASNDSTAMLDWLRPWIENPDYFFIGAGARSSNVNQMIDSLADPQQFPSTSAVGGLQVGIRPGQTVPAELKKLLAADSAMLALKLDADHVLQIHGRSHFPSVTEAKESADLLRGLLSAIQLMPEGAEGASNGDPRAELPRKLTTFLRGIKVASEDQFVSLSASQALPSLVHDINGAVQWATERHNQELTSAPNLKQLANAFELYHAQHGHYPKAQVMNSDGTEALYSWRVSILPYLGPEAAQLHREFDLQESWTSPHNQRLSQKMPPVFEHPLARMSKLHTANINGVANGMTPYQLPVGLAAAFFENRKVSKRDIVDGLDQTIMIMEQQPLVPWTAPIDVSVSKDQIQSVLNAPSAVLGAPLETVLFDQTSLQIARSTKPGLFWGMINPKDGHGVAPKTP